MYDKQKLHTNSGSELTIWWNKYVIMSNTFVNWGAMLLSKTREHVQGPWFKSYIDYVLPLKYKR